MVITLTSPLLFGVYDENSMLIKTISSNEKSDVALIKIIDEILNSGEYNLQKIIYANGPGSFMGIKVAYMVLKTVSMVRDCEFYAVSGFDLNENSPIRANKILSFVLENGKIELKKIQAGEFVLPQNLKKLTLSLDTLPNYVIQAV